MNSTQSKPFVMADDGEEDFDSNSTRGRRQIGDSIAEGMSRRGMPTPSQGSFQRQRMGAGRK